MTVPDWMAPMAATLTQERFTGPEWSFERRLDGIRVVAFKQDEAVRLLSRNRLPQDCPAIARAIASLPPRELVLDGEMSWSSTEYDVFDVLWIDGRDLRSLPLEERRAVLAELPFRAPVRRVTELDDPEPWELARREGWEGVIAKRRGSVYEPKRSRHWLKMKCELTETFVIGGFTEPQGSRVGLGALLVGRVTDGEITFAGKVGTGFDRKLLLELRARLDALEIPNSPFTQGSGLPRRAHWVKPEIMVEVSFIEWTGHGKLRHPRLRSVR